MPTHRPITVVTVLLAALTAGCGGGSADETTAAAPPTTAAAASAEPAGPAESSEPAQPFEGSWRAGPAPFAKVVAALDKAGMGQYADNVIQGNDPSSQLTTDLKVQGGFVLLSWSVDDRTQGVQDRQAYTASETAIELQPIGSSCRAAFNWTVTGDRLRFDLVDDTCPDYQGTPDAAIMVGLYASVPFQRVEE